MTPIRVLIVDDNLMLCTAVEKWLSPQPGITAVTCMTDWRHAARVVQDLAPDVVLLDIDMPGTSGLNLIQPIMTARPQTKVIMFSGVASRASVEQALDNGAAGYLVKDQEPRVIVDLIRRAVAEEIVLCPIASHVLMGSD